MKAKDLLSTLFLFYFPSVLKVIENKLNITAQVSKVNFISATIHNCLTYQSIFFPMVDNNAPKKYQLITYMEVSRPSSKKFFLKRTPRVKNFEIHYFREKYCKST